jgi:hypothetical protein
VLLVNYGLDCSLHDIAEILLLLTSTHVGNPVPGQAQTCGGVKLINGITNPHILIIGSPMILHI